MVLDAVVGNGPLYDTFISYAGEDREVALQIANGLTGNGLSVWIDRFILKPGDSVLKEIDNGLRHSRTGALVISPAFIAKNWPQYEVDVLARERIAGTKRLFPIWHNITHERVHAAYPGLSGVFALKTEDGLDAVVRGLVEELAGGAAIVAIVPSWEDPRERFLQGKGEALAGPNGRAFNIWEAVLDIPEDRLPIWFGGRLYSREDLLGAIYLRWYGDPLAATPRYVSVETLRKVGALMKDHGTTLGADWPT